MVRVGPAGWRLHKKGLSKYMYCRSKQPKGLSGQADLIGGNTSLQMTKVQSNVSAT